MPQGWSNLGASPKQDFRTFGAKPPVPAKQIQACRERGFESRRVGGQPKQLPLLSLPRNAVGRAFLDLLNLCCATSAAGQIWEPWLTPSSAFASFGAKPPMPVKPMQACSEMRARVSEGGRAVEAIVAPLPASKCGEQSFFRPSEPVLRNQCRSANLGTLAHSKQRLCCLWRKATRSGETDVSL